jgi:hypothetical protein
MLLLAAGSALDAQPVPTARATRATAAPVIDGRLSDAAWAQAEVLTGFVQKEPLEGRPASERTEVRVLYDADALYVGAWLFDAGELVVGRAARDAPLNDTDAFLLILDTYLDRQNGLVFATTPAGIEYDAQVTNEGQGGGFNLNWDGNWRVATSRDADGWYVEMRIPFSTLRYAGRARRPGGSTSSGGYAGRTSRQSGRRSRGSSRSSASPSQARWHWRRPCDES